MMDEMNELRLDLKKLRLENKQLHNEILKYNINHDFKKILKIRKDLTLEDSAIIIQSFFRMIIARNKAKILKKKNRILKEIFSTEKTYYEMLKIASIIYHKQLKESEGAKIGLNEKQIAIIFGNLDTLYCKKNSP